MARPTVVGSADVLGSTGLQALPPPRGSENEGPLFGSAPSVLTQEDPGKKEKRRWTPNTTVYGEPKVADHGRVLKVAVAGLHVPDTVQTLGRGGASRTV